MTVPIIDRVRGTTRLRIARAGVGYTVTRTTPGTLGHSLQIRRWRFTADQQRAAADTFLDELLAAGEALTQPLREAAERATRRALLAHQRMRPTSQAIRRLEQESVEKTTHYFNHGRAVAAQCAAIERQLDNVGFPASDRAVPAWITKILAGLQPAATGAPRP